MAHAPQFLKLVNDAKTRVKETNVADVKRRYGVQTLEEAFFAATGRTFEEETDQDDEYREVFG